jgi:hypothetical protein
MKMIMTVLALAVVSAQAFAGVNYPKVAFGYNGNGTVLVGVDGLCVAGDKLVTKKAQEVCVGSYDEQGACSKTETLVLATPVKYTAHYVTNDWNFVDVETTIPLSYHVDVTEKDFVVGYVDLTIPACAQ